MPCQKLVLDFGSWIFRIWVGIGTYDCFFLYVSFPLSFFFSHSDVVLRDGSETKSGSSKAFGLKFPFPRCKSESANSKGSKGSPTLSDRTGRILWFCFVCDCNCYLLLGGGGVGCAMGRTVHRTRLKWTDCTGLDWTGSNWSGRSAPPWLTCSSSILGSDLDLVLDVDLDGR